MLLFELNCWTDGLRDSGHNSQVSNGAKLEKALKIGTIVETLPKGFWKQGTLRAFELHPRNKTTNFCHETFF